MGRLCFCFCFKEWQDLSGELSGTNSYQRIAYIS